MPSELVNVEQAAAWDGEEGTHWAQHAQHYEAGVRAHHRHLFEAAEIAVSHQVLDVGCGTGSSTREAARRARLGAALGVDLSARMLDRAREQSRAEGLVNVAFEQADAQVHALGRERFDVVISSFGSMFFGDLVAAFRNIGRAIRSDGHVALLVWQELGANEWLRTIRGALAAGRDLPAPPVGAPGPFALADPRATQQVLIDAGFSSVRVHAITEPIQLGTDADDAFGFVSTSGVARGMLADLDSDAATRALEALRAALAAHESPTGVLLGSAAWLVTAARC